MASVSGEAVFERIDETRRLIAELEPILQSLMLNDSTIVDGLAQMLGTLQDMHLRTEQQMADLGREVGQLAVALARLERPSGALRTRTGELDRKDPEASLLAHLMPFMPNPVAIDVGANVGSFAQSLVAAGYEVFAFEPFPASYEALGAVAKRAAGRLHSFPYAIGAEDGSAELLVATDTSGAAKWDTSLYHSIVRHPMLEDLVFASKVPVRVRSLESLARSGEIPAGPALLKIDTEGADLEVIKGAGEVPFVVVVTEFWNKRHPFGLQGHGDIGDMARELNARGYPWHIAFYRVDETGELGYQCNAAGSVPKSWGNCLHFRDIELFRRSVAWCERVFA